MTNTEKAALSELIASDPRVVAWVQQKYPNGTRGAAAGPPADLLRQWGYTVPEGYSTAVQGKKGEARLHVYDKHDKWDTALLAAGTTMLGLGVGGALGVGPLAGGSGAASSAAGAASTLPSASLPTMPLATAVPGATTAGSAAGVGAAIKKGLSTADVVRDVLRAGGAGAADAADAMASNRSAGVDAAALQEQLNQNRQQTRNANVDAANRKMQQAAYLSDPNRGKTPGFSTYSRDLNLPPMDPAIVAAMRKEAEDTLSNNPGDFTIDPELLKASGAEKALGIGSVAATAASAIPDSVWKRLGRLIF